MSRAKTTSQIYAQKQKLFRLYMERAKRRATVAHPATGGTESLVGNWGNNAAKKIWRDAWKRWDAISKAADLLYNTAEHARHGEGFRPLWCKHCRSDAMSLFDVRAKESSQ